MDKFFRENVFTPVNTLIFFITMLSFIVALIVFFELVLSNYPVLILSKKLDIVTIACKQNPDAAIYVKKKVGSYFQDTENIRKVNEAIDKRKKDNFITFQNQVLPYLLVVFFMFLIFLIWFVAKGKSSQLEKFDYLLILLAVFSFIVEIIFYFVILIQWEFISDTEFIKTLLFK